MKRPARRRVDVLLGERGLCAPGAEALALLLAGRVYSGGRRVDKPGTLLAPDAPLAVVAAARYVSRGGDKLHHALACFAPLGLVVAGKSCVDVGAATGGFTDCLLHHGARKVYAVDVGWGQLHPRLRADARVVVRERTNARTLSAADFDEPIELVAVDASFIGIGKLVGAVAAILVGDGDLVALVKPQFEVDRRAATRARGVIRDPALREQAIVRARATLERAGLVLVAGADSPLRGPKGNLEHLLWARRRAIPPTPPGGSPQ